MDDADGRAAAAEEAWDAAIEVLDADELEPAALVPLREADRVLAPFGDEQSRERRARVLEGIVACHVREADGSALTAVVEPLLGGTWPDEALPYRLSAARIAVASALLPDAASTELAARAVGIGEASDDDLCRGLVAELLKLQAEGVMNEDIAHARALLERVAADFGDVDDPTDRAEDRLEDPYFRGRELIERPGQVAAAEAAFRQAAQEEHAPAWLELAVVLGWQAGREEDEEHAYREALGAELDPERLAMAGNRLGLLLHYGTGDRAAAREAFGRATTGTGDEAVSALRELAVIAVLDGDQEARRQLIAELAGRVFEDARRRDHPALVAASRLGYARPMIAVRAWRWRRARRRAQLERATS